MYAYILAMEIYLTKFSRYDYFNNDYGYFIQFVYIAAMILMRAGSLQQF